uniref:Vacuolar protein sorting-associated protein 33B n=1 Tax=Lygus hesperus TaxID=30085 RepID=A0A0A9XUZ1_LYGHE
MIILERTVPEASPNARITYAPVYTYQDISDFYLQAIRHEYTCVQIGHGVHDVLSWNDRIPTFNTDAADIIRWGWRTIMNTYDCQTETFRPEFRHPFRSYNYADLHTWVCAQTASHIHPQEEFQYSGKSGDSGGPMECSGTFFAVTQGTVDEDYGGTSISTPIADTLLGNSAENRDIMLAHYDRIRRGVEERRHLHPPNHKEFQLFDQPLSQTSSKILHNILLMTTTTMFALLF